MRDWIKITESLVKLDESAIRKYLPMFNAFPEEFISHAEYQIGQVVDVFKGNRQRLTWAMKWFRLYLAYEGTGSSSVSREISEPIIQRFSKDFPQPDAYRSIGGLAAFRHFYDLPIEGIQNYQYGTQTPDEILADFREMEDEFKKSGEQEVTLQGDEEIIMDFKDGYVWMDLKRGGCRQEAKSMGHCGNGQGQNGETILSLRKFVRKGVYRPCLTFILDRNGRLGEMKGRGNNKPSERYHRYIEALITSDRITGLKGGGYLPENNFRLNDLGDEARERISNSHPHLQSAEEIYSLYYDEKSKKEDADPAILKSYMEKLEDRLGEFYSVDFESESVMISDPEGWNAISSENDFEWWDDVDDIEENLLAYIDDLDEYEAKDIAKSFEEDIERMKDDFVSLLSFDNYEVSYEKTTDHKGNAAWAPVISLRDLFRGEYLGEDQEPDLTRDIASRDYYNYGIDEDRLRSALDSDWIGDLTRVFLTAKKEGSHIDHDIAWTKGIYNLYLKREREREEANKDQTEFDFNA